MYDYRAAMKEDILQALEEKMKYWSDWDEFDDMTNEQKREFLYDELFFDDGVTGNASGSYTFNSHKAAENLVGNTYLLKEAISAFEIDGQTVVEHIDDPEYFDVTIRCYLLAEVIADVVFELESEND